MEEERFLEVFHKSKMNISEFSKYFGIPYRTVQNWKHGICKCPLYLIELMEYKLDHEQKK